MHSKIFFCHMIFYPEKLEKNIGEKIFALTLVSFA